MRRAGAAAAESFMFDGMPPIRRRLSYAIAATPPLF